MRVLIALFLVTTAIWSPGPICGAEPAEDTIRAVVRVFHGPASGTGFFVATGEPADAGKRYLLVTAAHVFDSMAGEKCTIVFRAVTPDGRFERRPAEFAFRTPTGPLWVRHPQADVAVMPVDLPAGVDVQPYAESQIADPRFAEEGRVALGHEVYIPCYPVQFEANAAGFPVLRRGSIASYPLVPLASAQTILVDYSSFHGDSGAPVVVWHEKTPVVAGLVTGMQRQTEKTVTPSEERTFHTSLGLAVVVQSPLIRQTIDEWRKKTAK
jgi:hypothetical protein